MATPTQMLNNPAIPGSNFAAPHPQGMPMAQTPAQAKPKSNSQPWIITSVAGVAALALGGVGAYAYNTYKKDDVTPANDPNEDPGNDGQEPVAEEIDDQNNDEPVVDVEDVEVEPEIVTVTFDPTNVHQAVSVNDNMSFSEAFAAAHQEVGPGGVFVWHGGVYGTYTADEWNAMSPEDQQAFSSSFHYGAGEHTNHVAQHPHPTPHPIEIDPIVTDPNDVALVTEDDAPEITLISQEYDAENDMTVAYISYDDNMAMLADVDNDGTYDYIVSDFDGNGDISYDEVVDISDSHLSHADVANLPDYTNIDPYDDVMA